LLKITAGPRSFERNEDISFTCPNTEKLLRKLTVDTSPVPHVGIGNSTRVLAEVTFTRPQDRQFRAFCRFLERESRAIFLERLVVLQPGPKQNQRFIQLTKKTENKASSLRG
jgi:hypothetical protein